MSTGDPAPPQTPVAIGERAPDFTLNDQHLVPVRLADLRGSAVLLVFFPSAFSPVCHHELLGLRDRWAEVDREGLAVLGVCTDPVFALRSFADAEQVPFPLLTDFWPHGAVASAYGVLDLDFGSAKRSSFLLDADGVVRWSVHHPMPDPRSVDELLAAVDQIS